MKSKCIPHKENHQVGWKEVRGIPTKEQLIKYFHLSEEKAEFVIQNAEHFEFYNMTVKAIFKPNKR